MHRVTTSLLGKACRLFMEQAFPGGPETIPEKRRVYYDLPLDRPVADFIPPAPAAEGICQVLPAEGGGFRGFAFRLGSANFPHLKLKLQLIDYDHTTVWVFMVDTHDAFSREQAKPPLDHPDALAWLKLQAQNRELKERIELALEKAGLTTFNSLLRRDLLRATSPVEPTG